MFKIDMFLVTLSFLFLFNCYSVIEFDKKFDAVNACQNKQLAKYGGCKNAIYWTKVDLSKYDKDMADFYSILNEQDKSPITDMQYLYYLMAMHEGG